VKAALRLVRFYGGGVSLRDLLGSPRLMRLADDEMREEISSTITANEELAGDIAFAQHAGQFFGQGNV
jgi:hypothetical protein